MNERADSLRAKRYFDLDSESPRDAHERLHGDVGRAALDARIVASRHADLRGELLLGEPSFLADSSNATPNVANRAFCAGIELRRHAPRKPVALPRVQGSYMNLTREDGTE